MNHPQVWTTINKTEIDLSSLPGLLSNQLAVLLEIPLKEFKSQRDGPHKTQTGNFTENTLQQLQQWTDMDTNKADITNAILEAAELSIRK